MQEQLALMKSKAWSAPAEKPGLHHSPGRSLDSKRYTCFLKLNRLPCCEVRECGGSRKKEMANSTLLEGTSNFI